MEYGYGHTKEAAATVRQALKEGISEEVKQYGLNVSVKKANSGYGGPLVDIKTNDITLDKSYQYIINSSDGSIGDGPGKLVEAPVSSFPNGRPHYSARLITPEALDILNKKINNVLKQFGRDNDDAMTDYFDNTMPLFYGVSYEAK